MSKRKGMDEKVSIPKLGMGNGSFTHNWKDKIVNLCKFFEVSNLKLLQNKDLIPIACRKLSATEKKHLHYAYSGSIRKKSSPGK